MIKRLLSLVTAFVAFCCIANAQAFQRNEAGLGLKYNKIEKMAPTRAAAEGVVFTYAQGDTYVGVGQVQIIMIVRFLYQESSLVIKSTRWAFT